METNQLEELATDQIPLLLRVSGERSGSRQEFDKLAKLDEEWRDTWRRRAATAPGPRGEEKRQIFFRFHCHHRDVATALMSQLIQQGPECDDRKTAESIIVTSMIRFSPDDAEEWH